MNLRIAFVACNKNAKRYSDDPSFIYRCENLAAGLGRLGHTVWLGHISTLPWNAPFDIVVFHRPRATLRMRAVHAWLQRKGIITIADIDDLIFVPEIAPYSPGVINGLVPVCEMKRLFSSNYRALGRFKLVSVSTQPLAEHVHTVFPHAHVVISPNAVHWTWLQMEPPPPRDQRIVSYLPGTRSHDQDFASIAPAVARVLDRHPDIILSVTGPLNFSLSARPTQIIHHAKRPFSHFHENLYGATINLAPLESTPFTKCKSAIKVIEAAFWNIPTICSPLADAERFCGAGACIARNEAEFEQQLERLLTDHEYYSAVTTGLRERVLPLANVYDIAEKWLAFVTRPL